jgi:ADP-ribose pyrophosphatase YjhB (NUDIX family)
MPKEGAPCTWWDTTGHALLKIQLLIVVLAQCKEYRIYICRRMASTFSSQYGYSHTKHKINICSNCGLQGHHYKYCTEPITSYGIIAFRIGDSKFKQPNEIQGNCTSYMTPNLEYLLVQRRDSIGFIELLRAKYKLTDFAYIQEQIDGTTPEERSALVTKSFDELWTDLWGGTTLPENRQYRQEYEVAKQKFEAFSKGTLHNNTEIKLKSMIEATPVYYTTPEWGFPKGRRNVSETNYKCAIREFTEETGLKASDIHILENIEPITEIFCGNNNIHYKHIYYMAYIPSHVHVAIQPSNEIMMREIGNIGWFTFEDALNKIRPTNPEKKQVLEKVQDILNSCCPLFIGPMLDVSNDTQTEEPTVNRDHEHATASTRITNPWGRSRGSSTGTPGAGVGQC